MSSQCTEPLESDEAARVFQLRLVNADETPLEQVYNGGVAHTPTEMVPSATLSAREKRAANTKNEGTHAQTLHRRSGV